MKKNHLLHIFLGFLTLGIISCDPNSDINDELDKVIDQQEEEQLYYSDKTLIENGYVLLEEDYELSSNDAISQYKNFSSSATPADHLAEILTAKKFYGEVGIEYSVLYNYYQGGLSYTGEYLNYINALPEAYELTTEDYDSMGTDSGEPGKYNNFSSSVPAANFLPAFLLTKYPSAESGDKKAITYAFYDGVVNDIVEIWEFNGTVWAVSTDPAPEAPEVPDDVVIYELMTDDYDSMGEESGQPGKYNNFSSSIDIDDYLPIFLSIKYPYAKADNKVALVYRYYGSVDGTNQTFNKMVEYTYDGQVWSAYESTTQQASIMTFKGAERVWVLVPPITLIKTEEAATETYTLEDADYELVGDGQFHNFYIKNMTPEEVDAEIIPKITKILKNKFELAIGDIYEVTYKYYDGAGGNSTIKLKAVEDN